MKTDRICACVVVLLCFCAGGLVAQQADSNSATSANNLPAASQPVPRLVMFSGTVKDLTGKPLTGPVDLNFAIYKEQAAAEPLWQESQTLNVDEQGHYTVLLGAMQQEGLPVELFTTGEARWLGVSAGKLPEQPRTLLVSVPYALKAGDAETLGGKPASAFMLAQTSGSGTTLPSGVAVTPDTAKLGGGLTPNVAGTGTQNYIPLWTNSTGTLGNSVIYQSSGLVGIGTTTPAGKLDVAGSVGHFQVDTSGAQFRFSRGSANYFLASTAGGYFDFVVNGLTPSDATASLKLAANGTVDFMAGNVGIGTLTPAQKLDVKGNLRITGAGNAIIFPDGTVQSTAGSGSGGGTVTGVTAGTGLAGGGTGGNVTLGLASSSCTAGSALTGLPLTCQPFATLGSNLFTGDQGITGKVTASGSTSELNGAILHVTQYGQSSAHWSLGNYAPAAIRGDATGGPGAGGAAGVLGTAQSNDAVGVGGFNTDGVGLEGVSIGPNFGAGVVGWCEQNASCIGVGSFLRMQGNLFEGRVAADATDDEGITKFLVDGSGNVRANAYLDLAGNPIPAAQATDLNCAGCVSSSEVDFSYAGSSSKGGAAANALLLNGLASSAFQPAGSYATLGANTFTGTQTISSGNLSVGAGNVVASGSISGAGVSSYVTAGNTSVQAGGGGTGVYAIGSSVGVYGAGLTGVKGYSGSSGTAVEGQFGGDYAGIGVLGDATYPITNGAATGVKGTVASSTNGSTGVFGYATSLSGATIGVHAKSDGSNGIGVLAEVTDNSFTTYAIKATAQSPLGAVISAVGSNGSAGLYVETDTDVTGDFNRTAGSDSDPILLVRSGSTNKFKVRGDGNVYAAGTFTGGGADFAEAMAVRGDRDQYQPGDVLTIDLTSDRRLTLARDAYSTHVAGIYSTKPGMLGRPYPMDDPRLGQGIPLAVVGIVPCKVSAENGPIERGDLLVSSATPGHAMKGTDRTRMLGAVVGKALEPLASGTGVIQILVTLQ